VHGKVIGLDCATGAGCPLQWRSKTTSAAHPVAPPSQVSDNRPSGQHWARGNGNYEFRTYQPNSGYSQAFHTCWRCGHLGHLKRNCAQVSSTANGDGTKQTSMQYNAPNSAVRGSKMRDKANVYLSMEINRSTYPCLLDSGCEYTVIPRAIVELKLLL